MEGVTPVAAVAGVGLIDRHFTLGLTREHPRPLGGHQVVAKRLHVLLRIEELVNKTSESLGADHDRPGAALAVAMHRPTEHPSHHLIHHAVVGIALVITLLEPFRQQEAPDEIPGGDVARAQLRFQKWLAVGSHGMKKDLPIGGFD